jgi:hypothetical protein
MLKPVRFSNWMPGENLSGSHLQWEPSIQFSSPILTENRTQNRCRFSLSGWEPHNTDYDHNVLGKFIKFPHNKMQISSLPQRRFSIMQEILLEVKISFFWVLSP